jgi:hypothetical protein
MTKAKQTKADGSYCGHYSDLKSGSPSKKVANPKVAFSGSPPADTKQAAADKKFFTKEPPAAPVRFRYGRV